MKPIIATRRGRLPSVSLTLQRDEELLITNPLPIIALTDRERSPSQVIQENPPQQVSPPIYREEKYRFVILVVVGLSNFMDSMLCFLLAPISSIIHKVSCLTLQQYDMSYGMINLYYTLSLVQFLPFTLLSIYMINRLKIKKSLIIAGFITSLGSWLRLYFNSFQIVAFIGQILATCFQPLYLMIATRVSVIWFKHNSRVLASTIIFICYNLGYGFGAFLPALIVKKKQQFSQDQMFRLTTIEAILFTSVYLLTLLFYKQTPSSPPSAAANSPRMTLSLSLKKLFTSTRFYLILISYILAQVPFTSYQGIFEQILDGYDYQDSPQLFSIITNGYCVTGLVGCLTFAYLADTIQKIKIFYLILAVSSALSYALVTWTIGLKIIWVTITTNLVFGFFTNAMFSIGCQFAAQEEYPISEEISGGVLLTFVSLLSFAVTTAAESLFDLQSLDNQSSAYLINVAYFSSMALSCIFAIFIKEKRKRSHQQTPILAAKSGR